MILNQYLKYLNEKGGVITRYKPFIKTNLVSGVKSGLLFGIVIVPSITAAWRSIHFMFSDAARKCGGVLASRSPGFKICVSKEKIKALQKKNSILKNLLSQCSKSNNPTECKEKISIELQKCQNKINIQQNKIKENLAEVAIAAPIAKTAIGVSSFVISTAGMIAAEKALNLAFRRLAALFSEAIKRCQGYKKDGPERKLCISTAKLNILNKQLLICKNLMSNCNKMKNRETCKEKITDKIKKINREIEIQKNNVIAYRNEIRIEKREKELKK